MAPPPPTPHGIKLAVNIISTDFGNLVAKVCECLLRRGYLSRPQISRNTELPVDKVTKCLWVLIQHNCVQAFAHEQEGGALGTIVVTQYMALFNNIIHRLRFSKFLNAVMKEEVDKEGSGILQGLLQHGRLTLPQILDRAKEISNEGNDAIRDTCNESFVKLVHSRLVERCPFAEPFIPLPTIDSQQKQSGRAAKKVRVATLEERALAKSIPMDAERFSILNEYDVDSDENKKDDNFPSAKVGEKRKHDSVEVDSEVDLLGPKGEPVWRVNFEEFMNRLRKKACVEFVRAAYDNSAAVILKSMLKGAKSTDDTVSLSLESIFEDVVNSEEGSAMDLDLVRCSLEQLHFCSEEDDVYSINLKGILEKARLEEAESLISKRYGNEAFRIFSSLSAVRAMHTDQISEKTLTDKKDTPKILYRLWQDGFLEMEKISTGGQKQTDVINWSLKMDKIWRKVLDELHHAALNLSLRCAHEVEKSQEVEIMYKKSLGKERSKEIEDKIRRRQRIYITLNFSLMEIDDAIMLFSDFLF